MAQLYQAPVAETYNWDINAVSASPGGVWTPDESEGFGN